MDKKILLTFDLEEFDLPLEYGCPIAEEDQIEITNNGLQRLTGLLLKYNIPATFFTTSFYANKNKELIRNLSENHEIASHSKDHSDFTETDLLDSKVEIERITGKKIYGFRMPHFKKIDLSLIKATGYSYDSSISPTFIPGRYNNLLAKRKIYYDTRSNLIEVPVSVCPVIRFPLFWLIFKNIPLPIYLHMCKITILKDSYLHLYFHPWEFAELDSFKIPWYIKTLSGSSLSERFEKLIVELEKTGDFSTISGLLDIAGSQ
ncbi:MAG TPA: polysaccharide deacetylase family protein [Bacteroidales bacterium]|nr:polysaccharide deacetylase family protein [Bacteroidales bacterium]